MFLYSDPLIKTKSAPNSLHKALATVVLPTPAVPHNNKFGISLLATKSKNKSIEDLFDNLGGIDPNTGKPRKC